jgi:hypothetical protein
LGYAGDIHNRDAFRLLASLDQDSSRTVPNQAAVGPANGERLRLGRYGNVTDGDLVARSGLPLEHVFGSFHKALLSSSLEKPPYHQQQTQDNQRDTHDSAYDGQANHDANNH